VVLLHGGGYSALTWSLMAAELIRLCNCRIVGLDLRGHGETKLVGERLGDTPDLAGELLERDVEQVVAALAEPGPLVLVGHSMGGALAARLASGDPGLPGLAGLVVVDVVEGTALDALASMHTVLQARPRQFAGLGQAVEWAVRSGQVRNAESARVSMPGQLVNEAGTPASQICEADVTEEISEAEAATAARAPRPVGTDSISEEGEADQEEAEFRRPEPVHLPEPPQTLSGKESYRWRIDLARTESHWAGWFQGLSARFLAGPSAKLLLLAGVDRLDRELTVGQMQGKFQLQVLPQVGHTVHEDSPDRVAEVIASFLVRNKLCTASDNFSTPTMPGC